MENKRLIINVEYFLECYGTCSGCFLSSSERRSKDVFNKNLVENIVNIIKNNKISSQESEVIVGFGRGNLLNMSESNIEQLLNIIDTVEREVHTSFNEDIVIKYEVSTSLVGKVNLMISNAKLMLDRNKNIYFNMVINSEIISQSFWENYNTFTSNMTRVRKSWGWVDNTGDILVLNINPEKLPDIDLIKKYFGDKESPINISVFPFDKKLITDELKKDYILKLNKLSEWLLTFWSTFQKSDLNLKNFLESFNQSADMLDISDIQKYHRSNVSAYFFIDKYGKVTEGSLSTMGEVDYHRLIGKYDINPSIENALVVTNKTMGCFNCEVKDVCIGSGAYLSMLSNYSLIGKSNECLNGYKEVFLLSKQ